MTIWVSSHTLKTLKDRGAHEVFLVGDRFEVLHEQDFIMDGTGGDMGYERAYTKGYADGKYFNEKLTCLPWVPDPDVDSH